MRHQLFFGASLTTLAILAGGSAAMAGGLEANGYNWDHLFESEAYAARGTIAYVTIDQAIEAGGETVSTSADRVYYNLGFKADLNDAVSCLVSAQNPFGSGNDRDPDYAASNPISPQSISERVTSNDLGLTCTYGFGVGPGVLSVIGGASAQQLYYDATIPVPLFGPGVTGTVDLGGSGFGWRAGLAYEMPELALRVTGIYNAAIDYELDGTAFGGLPIANPGTADVTTPQSFELKAQSGVAPGWLVLGSVKWVDWSVLDVLTVENAIAPISTDLSYEDGWTLSAGVAHTLTDDLTVLGTLTWDKGTSTADDAGVLEAGSQTDRWGVSLGGAYDVSDKLQLTGGLSYSILQGGSNQRGETWDGGSVLAVSAGLKASF